MSSEGPNAEPAVAAPLIDCTLDADYLTEALRRGGRTGRVRGDLELSELTDGRTGARITAIGASPEGGSGGYVLKRIARARGIAHGLGNPGEGAFWLAGTTRHLPAPIINPTLDVALHQTHDEWWILMDDLSDGIVPRGALSLPITSDYSTGSLPAVARPRWT